MCVFDHACASADASFAAQRTHVCASVSLLRYCAEHGGSGVHQHALACVKANVNILSLYGDRIPYNTCRNIEYVSEAPHTVPAHFPPHVVTLLRVLCARAAVCDGRWQVCAAKGWLQGQQRPSIVFAKAPKTLEPNSGPHPIGSCTGYAPQGCKNGFASSDIVRAPPPHPHPQFRACTSLDRLLT